MIKNLNRLYSLFLILVLFAATGQLKAQVIWTSSSGTAWLLGSNWAGSVVPNATQVAQFNATPTSSTAGVGINMDTAGGSYSVGTIYVSPTRATGLNIGNSAITTPGILNLGGTTFSGIPSVILANQASNLSRLTIQNTQGAGGGTLSINTGSSNKTIVTGAGTTISAGNTISLNVPVSGTGGLTLLGGGTWTAATATGNNGGILRLGKNNTFTGGITVGNSDGTQSGILTLDTLNAINNSAGNNVVINDNSQLMLSAASGATYPATAITLTLNGNGNNAATSGAGALYTTNNSNFIWDGPVTLGSDASINVAGVSGTLTLTSNINGAGRLTKRGLGLLNLLGNNNNWAGGTTLLGGRIIVASGSGISQGDFAMNQVSGNLSVTFNNAAQTIGNLNTTFTSTTATNNIVLNGCRLTIDQLADGSFGGAVATQTSTFTGTGSIVKNGSGRLTLTSAANTFSGGLKINAGEIRYNPLSGTSVSNPSPDTLNGGSMSTVGIARPFTFNFGTLMLANNSAIYLGTDTINSIKFANSAAIGWTASKTLLIYNWRGNWTATAGTRGRIFAGTNATGITAAQLAQVRFVDDSGYQYNATQLSTGELVPIGPTITVAAASYGPFCNNTDNVISVSFTSTGTLTGPFKVQLSDASGVFPADYTSNIIGTGSTSPIAATIPAGTTAGTGYRIRVINQFPVGTTGSNNGSNINISGVPVLGAITGPSSTAIGASVVWSNSTAGGNWTTANAGIATVNSTGGVVTGVSAGSTTITYTYTNFCGLSSFVFDTIDVFAVPSITSFTPTSGIAGTTVTITGSNFNPTVPGNVVNFGNVKATVLTASTSMLTVTVPVNAQFDRITVTNTANGQVATSGYPFLPLYNNSGLMNDTVNFKDQVTVAAGALPIGITAGDIDGDGKTDLVVANSGPNNIYVYRNTSTTSTISTATFTLITSLPTRVGPYYLKLADLTGDGLPEIIVACNGTTTGGVCVFKNTSVPGTISTAARTDVPGIINATDVTAADIDGDGKQDIVATTTSATPLMVIRNTTTGGTLSFTTTSYATSAGSTVPVAFKVVATDLNNDNKPDIALTHYNLNTIAILKNNSTVSGGVSLTLAATLATGTNPTGIAVADLDNDGLQDIAVTNVGSNTLSLLKNNSAAGSISFGSATNFVAGPLPEDLAINDVNADGKPDIAVGNYAGSTISVFKNTATSGGFTAASLATPTTFFAGPNPAGIAWTDMDSDGKPDLAVVSGNSSSIRLLKNYPLPPVGITTGVDSICAGVSTTLINSVSGGRWASLNTAIATVNSVTGMVYGVASGIDTIVYYTVAQGDTNYAYFTLTVGSVNTVADIVLTNTTICEGASSIATNTITGGTWSSSNATVASVDTTGLITGLSIGSTVISYTTSSFCGTSWDTAVVTVTPGSGYTMGTITGPGVVCLGSSITLTDTSAGGTWSSSNATVATVDVNDVVTGLTEGTTIISYTINSACGLYVALKHIGVNVTPDATNITGPANICVGVPVTYTNTENGGTWSTVTGNVNITTEGIATGISAGIDTIRYLVNNACGSSSGYKEVVITAQPNAGDITGPSVICLTDTVSFIASVPGGSWRVTNSYATSLGNGQIRGLARGTDTVLYIATNTCGADTASAVADILAAPVAGTITGSSTVCQGAAITLRDTVSGGIWSSLNGNTIVADSIVTGVNAGTDTVRYTVTNACGTAVAIKKITINATTPVDTIAGPSSVCTGAKITLTNATAGGTWSRTNTNASITSVGVVTGVTPGLDTILYTPAGTCPTVASKVITVNASPAIGVIVAPATACVGDTIVLRDTATGGTWSSTGRYSVVTDSFFTGTTAGIDTVFYTVTTPLCGATAAIKRITVNPLPYADEITGGSILYVGESLQLKDSVSGGTWTTKGINTIVSSTGKLGGLKEGVDTVLYITKNTCGSDTARLTITVLPAGGAGGSIAAIQLYPNPNNGAFTVKLLSSVTQSVPVVISSADFKVIKVMDMTTNTETQLTSELASGVYFLSVASEKGWFSTKFVIVN